MLLHQFIVVAVATVKRFETALLALPGKFRRVFLRDQVGGAAEFDVEPAETERAA